MMAFPSIDAVRNLRSNRVRTARLTPPPGYGDAWRRLVQRNAAQRVQQCVSQRTMVPSPDIAGGPRGAHCTATAAATAAVAKVVLACSVALCCALLRSAAATQRPAVVANGCRGGVTVSSPQRKRFCTLLPSARKAAGCPVPSTPQTCKESAPCVPRRSGIGIARRRCDEHHRQPGASESPKGARTRATAPEHGTANLRLLAKISHLTVTARGRCPVETGGVAAFAARSMGLCAARRRNIAGSSRHARAPACAAAPRPAKAASTAAVGSKWARLLAFACEQRAARMRSCKVTAASELSQCERELWNVRCAGAAATARGCFNV